MKRPLSISLALLASLTIWLVNNLSETTSDIVSVQLMPHSNIEGRSSTARESVTVTAAVSGSGFALLKLAFRRNRPVDITFDAADLQHREGEFYYISDNTLFKYAGAILGPAVSVQSFVSHSLTFRFLEENHKKVPIVPLNLVNYRSQYMPYGPMELSADSVIVYGEPLRLASIDKVLTRQIMHKDVRRSFHGTVALDQPAGVRLSQKEVTYSQDVTRYVEYSCLMPVGVRNLPEGLSLAVLPAQVQMNFRFVFPVTGNPAAQAEVYVDYDEFASSISGKCMVRCSDLPDVTICWESSPQMCVCVETSGVSGNRK